MSLAGENRNKYINDTLSNPMRDNHANPKSFKENKGNRWNTMSKEFLTMYLQGNSGLNPN